MTISRSVRLMAAMLVLGCAQPAAAQIYEAVGTRAQGMGGAFVAVADDATASWWNPAGLATGSFLSLVLERGTATEPSGHGDAGPARRDTATGFAAAFPALGVSYYRLRISEIAPDPSTTGDDTGGRQDQEAAAVSLRTLAFSQFGTTVGQSIGDHLVLAATLKVIRAGMATSTSATADKLLSRADDLDVSTESEGDVDAGVMAAYGPVRLGVAVKYLRAPEFGEGDQLVALKRQARAGMALVTSQSGVANVLTAAVDVDLTRTATVHGDVRHLAFGVEAWLGQRRLALRSGVSVDTVGPAHTTGSVGASFGGRGGFYLNGALLFGSEEARNGWNTSLSMTF